MKALLTSSGGITIVHFILVLLGLRAGFGAFPKLANVLAQPGMWVNDAIGGNNVVFWILMILNSILWGAVLGTLLAKFVLKGK